ncbi:hypothetical protein BH09MYX1_BH09MYX1_55230 [soil metagenome]
MTSKFHGALGALVLTSAAVFACGHKTPDPVTPEPPKQDLLAPVLGHDAQEAETRAVLKELIQNLPPDQRARVEKIPMVFEKSNEVNAFAGCDDKGPFIAGTTGLLDIANGIAQTLATDEMRGTKTYDAYLKVAVEKVLDEKPNLFYDLGNLPPDVGLDKTRLSRAHELFDDIVAFTFGHELAHHYLGHTPCATKTPLERDLANLGNIFVNIAPILNQPAEIAADQNGIFNVLFTGRNRARHPFTEKGARLLLQFFSSLEDAAGSGNRSFLRNFLSTHPPSPFRLRVLDEAIARWHQGQ